MPVGMGGVSFMSGSRGIFNQKPPKGKVKMRSLVDLNDTISDLGVLRTPRGMNFNSLVDTNDLFGTPTVSSIGGPPTVWTFQQSSFYGSFTGYLSQAKMMDGQFSSDDTVMATNNAAGAEWMQADFGNIQTLSNIYIRGLNSYGGWPDSSYTSGFNLKYSVNGSSWTFITVTSGHTNGNLVTYNLTTILGAPVQARYVRFDGGGWMALGDFYFD